VARSPIRKNIFPPMSTTPMPNNGNNIRLLTPHSKHEENMCLYM
jgi:hypothetical protein